MKILTVCSGLDFLNYTRRATIEAIHDIHPELDILLFNSIQNLRKDKITTPKIKFYFYHFWIVEKLRKFKILVLIEYLFRSLKWKKFFSRYDVIFLIDPNQYYLLPYLSKSNKLVYLLRDPSLLLDQRSYHKELSIIKRTNAILAISENLCSYYFSRYYGFIPENVHLWSNSVDLKLWNYDYWKGFQKVKERPVIGLAGNIDFVTDIELLTYIAGKLPGYDFEFAGKIDLDINEKNQLNELLSLPNVKHLGFIPFNEFPSIVINWRIGLVAAKPNQEYARYLNNNKQYQYLALGKPFVSYRLNADYKEFGDMVFIAENPNDYIDKIELAILKSEDKKSIETGLLVAGKQSADIRAKKFLSIIENI